MNIAPLDKPASIPVLRRLHDAGVLNAKEAEALEAQVRSALPWKEWLDRSLLAVGAVLILTGIGYFFAHNWDHLSDFDKLGLAAGAVFASLVAATWLGLDRFAGKVLLLAACALVGVYLAVFGQVYQTGAENYELFTGWAILVFPWVALGRFVPLWIFWVALLNFALGFFWPVTNVLDFLDRMAVLRHETISLALLNGAALLIREFVARRVPAWIDQGWSALILLAGAIIPLSIETSWEIFNTWERSASNSGAVFACFAYALVVTGMGFYYSCARFSLPALAILTLNACTVLSCLAIRVIDIDRPNGEAGLFILVGIVILAIFGAGVYFLRTQRLAHQPH